MTSKDAIAALGARERVELAKEKITKVVDRISGLIALAEHNALIVYSPLLASQIPPSTAGHAFNVFQKAMHSFEIVQLCALWDKPDGTLAHNSIPTVHALVDDDEVVAEVLRDIRAFWPTLKADHNPESSLLDAEVDAAVAEYNRITADEEAAKASFGLADLRARIPKTLNSPLLASVKNMRDRYLAHALDETFAERRGAVTPMKYGDERLLLQTTTEVVEGLYLWITGTHFDLEENRRLQGKRASALWERCFFQIKPRT